MSHFTFNGTKTIVWLSPKTGKPLAPREVNFRFKIEAENIHIAIERLREALANSVSNQPGEVKFSGIVYRVESSGRILQDPYKINVSTIEVC